MNKLGICPIPSEDFLRRSLGALRERHVLDGLDEEALELDAGAVSAVMPDHLFPDCILDLPLLGGGSEGFTLSFDCAERCCLEYQSSGAYFQELGVSARCAPEDRDDVLLLRFKGGSVSASYTGGGDEKAVMLSDGEAAEAFLARIPFLRPLSGLPLRCSAEQDADVTRVTVGSGPVFARKKFSDQPYRQTVLDLLAAAGVSAKMLNALDGASYNLGIPFYDREQGFRKWISYIDIVSFTFTLRGREVTDCRAGVRISDKCLALEGKLLRRARAYQWHITDLCDQRCRHCYLFAEDKALNCISMPWEELLLTLGQVEEDAAGKGCIPYPVLTGGDPVLHPDFWRFAQELHRRGIQWSILGNPFHLDPEVCKRLYQLGCLAYQLSLDGLSAWHDYIRKSGSFDATVRAVGFLNDAGIKPHLMATVSRQNKEDVLQCMDIAAEHHAASFSFARYCATSPEKAAETYMGPEEYRDFLLRYYQKTKQFRQARCRTQFPLKEHLFTLLRYELGEFSPTQYGIEHPDVICGGCHMGQNVSILPNGDVMACRRTDSVIGNVKTEPLSRIMAGELCKKYRDIRNIRKCRDCELLQWCRGCRAVGINVTGDLWEEDPCCWKQIKNRGRKKRQEQRKP